MGVFRVAVCSICVLFCMARSAQASVPTLDFTVTMSEAVTVNTGGGTPYIGIDVGGVSRTAVYTAGTGTSTLTFSYTPTLGDLDLDGISIPSAVVTPNGGTITDLNGNPETNFSFAAPALTGVKVSAPSLAMDFINGHYTLNGTSYGTLPSLITAAGGSFSRTSIGTYFDSTGTLQTAAANTPRFDYNPSTLSFRGLLMEEARANRVRNNTIIGAVAGTPGTPPTNWAVAAGSGISSSIIGTGSENGINYVDIRFFGTSTATTFPGVYFETSTQFPATSGTIATASAFVKLVGGSWANTTTKIMVMYNANAAGTNLSQYATNGCIATSAALATQRCTVTSSSATFSNAATAYLRPYYQFTVPAAGLAVDVTLRFGLPQIESGAFVTSPIPTSGAAVTRTLDSLSIPVGTWYNTSAGTFLNHVEWICSSGSSYPMFFRVDDTTSVNRWNAYYNMSGVTAGVDAYNAAALQGSWSAASAISDTKKIAAAQAINSANAAFDGVLKTLDASWSPPTVTRLILDGGNANKWHKLIKYYPLRATDTQLQLLSQ